MSLCKLLLSTKSGECLVVVEGLHVESLLLLASVVASSVSTLSVSTSSITASVISSVVVITIIVKVGTASSVGTALESQIFAINDKLVGLSFLTSEFSGFVLVDLLAFDDFALQHVLTVVSFSGSFWVISLITSVEFALASSFFPLSVLPV